MIVNDELEIPDAEFEFTFARSAGPGGQRVNKVSTKAVLRWNVRESPSLPEPVRQRLLARCRRRISTGGELLISSQRYRDQSRNVADCLEKLRVLLAELATPPKERKPTAPTRAARKRRQAAKQQRSEKKRARSEPDWEE